MVLDKWLLVSIAALPVSRLGRFLAALVPTREPASRLTDDRVTACKIALLEASFIYFDEPQVVANYFLLFAGFTFCRSRVAFGYCRWPYFCLCMFDLCLDEEVAEVT